MRRTPPQFFHPRTFRSRSGTSRSGSRLGPVQNRPTPPISSCNQAPWRNGGTLADDVMALPQPGLRGAIPWGAARALFFTQKADSWSHIILGRRLRGRPHPEKPAHPRPHRARLGLGWFSRLKRHGLLTGGQGRLTRTANVPTRFCSKQQAVRGYFEAAQGHMARYWLFLPGTRAQRRAHEIGRCTRFAIGWTTRTTREPGNGPPGNSGWAAGDARGGGERPFEESPARFAVGVKERRRPPVGLRTPATVETRTAEADRPPACHGHHPPTPPPRSSSPRGDVVKQRPLAPPPS